MCRHGVTHIGISIDLVSAEGFLRCTTDLPGVSLEAVVALVGLSGCKLGVPIHLPVGTVTDLCHVLCVLPLCGLLCGWLVLVSLFRDMHSQG